MKIGVILPQLEIGADPAVIKEYAQTAEGLGYSHILVYDHVVGADLTNRPDWKGSYNLDSLFHEPFVLFGYLAGLTGQIELVTGVIILPQRQTVLVAKQAAEIDVLSQGRLRLGIGVGWNAVEYEALNESFTNRGRREEEQIEVLRLLWTNESVNFKGKWHSITEAGLNPLPVQRPIPIWLGGSSDPALRRATRMADGWMPQFRPTPQGVETVERVQAYLREAGRDPQSFGTEARLTLSRAPREEWRQDLDRWQELGADYLSVNTMGIGLESPRDHIEMIKQLHDELGVADFNRS